MYFKHTSLQHFLSDDVRTLVSWNKSHMKQTDTWIVSSSSSSSRIATLYQQY